jgi:hypothetical protein
MRTTLSLAAMLVIVAASASVPSASRLVPSAVGPSFQSIGPLAFGPGGVLYAGDKQAATIFALNLGAQAAGAVPGTKDVEGIDAKIASLVGTAATEIAITDLAVHPTSKNTFLSVMRGQGAGAQAALVRVDGAGTLALVALDAVTFTSVGLPNPPQANPAARRDPRTQSITDLAFADGRLFVAGLSNEEFASKLWSVPYPFATADRGTSVEIFHTNHDAVETRSPVMAFVPHVVANEPHIIAGYTCTPLVKFPLAALQTGEKVRGTTIAELGSGNQPLDMVINQKGGQEYLLMTNSSRGVMKIPTASFAGAASLTAAIRGTGGVPFETVAAMTGIEQLDLLDATRSVVVVRGAAGRSLQAVILP